MPPTDIFVLVYASAAWTPFTSDELLVLLEQSRIKNAAVDVTGLLLHKDGNFFQVLEGPEAAVRQVFGRIERDRRHHTIIELFDDHFSTRLFSQWAMGFEDAHRLDPTKHPGLSTFLQRPDAYGESRPEHDDILIFLRTFRDL